MLWLARKICFWWCSCPIAFVAGVGAWKAVWTLRRGFHFIRSIFNHEDGIWFFCSISLCPSQYALYDTPSHNVLFCLCNVHISFPDESFMRCGWCENLKTCLFFFYHVPVSPPVPVQPMMTSWKPPLRKIGRLGPVPINIKKILIFDIILTVWSHFHKKLLLELLAYQKIIVCIHQEQSCQDMVFPFCMRCTPAAYSYTFWLCLSALNANRVLQITLLR